MDISLERDGTAIGSLFQQIICDMKNTSPLWEDFMAKASKLHACLRATIQAIAAYLDAFQKIADAATNSKGATKEIGTALTRVCLRHKAVETRMKTFTTAIMDCLIIPLQDKLEDWKRQTAVIDKDHAKEHKRCRTELKKRSSDTLRLQKKAKKGQPTDTIQSLVETSMQDITQKRAELDAVERKSLRAAMVEERMRYCTFVNLLQPVVKEECEVMYELGHLQEAMDSIAIVTKDPNVLPQPAEELILESKTSMNLYSESPVGSHSHGCSNSLGSRKSSVCSISSMNSSDSSGSPGHQQYQRSISQLISPAIRLKPGESSDSGFCSSSALTSQTSTTSSNPTHAVSTWPPHSQQDVVATTTAVDRPHTISTAYEKGGHQRPALTVYTFQSPEIICEAQKSPANVLCRPPLPIRCSSLERPLSSTGARNASNNMQSSRQCPSPLPAHITKEHPIFQPTYVNMSELASMAASKITNTNSNHQPPPPPLPQLQQHYQPPSHSPPQQQPQYQPINSPVLSIASSLVSSDSSATNHHSSPDISADTTTPQINSPNTNETQPNTPLSSAAASITALITGGVTIAENNADTTNPPSPENDFKSIGSVLEKLSMFEKIQNNIATTPLLPPSTPSSMMMGGGGGGPVSAAGCGLSAATVSKVESILNRKNEEIYKAIGSADKDPDQNYEDSIQELNNLIGELDSFQKEHELSLQLNGVSNNLGGISNHPTTQSTPSNHQVHNNNYQLLLLAGKDIDNNYDRVSIGSSNIGSLGYSIPSNTSSECKFNYSAADVQRYFNENSSSGFDSNESSSTATADIVMPHDAQHQPQTTLNESELYVKENTEIVVLRRKDVAADLNKIIEVPPANEHQLPSAQQRFSSFKSDVIGMGSASVVVVVGGGGAAGDKRENTISYNGDDVADAAVMEFKMGFDERLRLKPIISPRPASLSGCVTRITRRSSINSTKPPPPVRRSSSVTPSHHVGMTNSPSLSQQNLMNTSSESLPPPPPYLLDASGRTSPGKVTETVKALTELRHMPASPGVIRRAQALAQMQQMQQQSPTAAPPNLPQYNAQQQQQYHYQNQQQHPPPPPPQHYLSNTPPRIDQMVNGTYAAAPSASCTLHKNNQNTTTLHTNTPPSPHQQQLPSQTHHNQQNTNYTDPSSFNNSTYRSTSNATSSPSQSGIYAQPKHVSKMSSFRNSSPVGTTKQQPNSNLMAQLNARINKHGGDQSQLTPSSEKKSFAQPIYDTRNNVQHQQQRSAEQKVHRVNHHSQPQQQQVQQQNHNHILQQQQQQQQQQIHHHQQQQQQLNEAIYTRAADRNHHYQQQQLQQQQHHHVQQQHQQQQQQYIQTIDGKNPIYASHHHSQQQMQQQQQQHHHHHPPATVASNNHRHIHQKIYVSTNPFITTTTAVPPQQSHYSPTSFGKDSTTGLYSAPSPNYHPSSNEKTSSTRSKTKVGFLENLNAKLAEQRLSGKAFAVRNLINSKALARPDAKSHIPVPTEPDPRICHESLMDQIKRGATLKRNKSINDRSAPKIH